MANFLIINLADQSGFGAISSLEQGVKAKKIRTGFKKKILGKNIVEKVDAFDLLEADKARTLSRNDGRVTELRSKILASKKIYLATHGTPTDTNHAFKAAAGGVPLCTARELASFMLLVMPSRSKRYHLVLSMCYGARTDNYLSQNLDHQGQIPFSDLQTSFAYKFYRRICSYRKVLMTARTGALAFDAKTGVSSVEQEISIDARIDKENFLRGNTILPIINDWKALRGRNGSTRELIEEFNRVNKEFKEDPNKVPNNPDEIIIKQYQDMMRTKRGFENIMFSNQDREKYGKIVYSYDQSTLTVYSKYGNGTTDIPPGHVLYSGILV